MWFKNLCLYQLEKQLSHSAESLHEALSTKAFTACSATQRESIGWVPALGKNTQSFVHQVNGFMLISMAIQERILPASVIREELDECVDEIEARDNRRVSTREKRELRMNIEDDLLPKAFTRTKQLDAFIDLKNGWLVVNSTSEKKAEQLITLLRKSLGSFPVVPFRCDSLSQRMGSWLIKGKTPDKIELGAECELKSHGDDHAVAIFRKHELVTDEVTEHLRMGKYASKLALVFDDRLSFVLDDGFGIKKLKFLSILEEQMNEQDPETHAERLDIEFTIMTGEISALLAVLSEAFNVEERLTKSAPVASSDRKDPEYDKAVRLVRASNSPSISYLQRCLKVGYDRANNLLEAMQQEGLVTPVNSQGRREVLNPAGVL